MIFDQKVLAPAPGTRDKRPSSGSAGGQDAANPEMMGR